jgi:hypothetical protein
VTRAFACLGLGVALMAWQVHEVATDPQGYWLYVRDPARWDGAPAVISIFEVESILGPNRLTVARGQSRASVEAPTGDRTVGEEITVLGHFRASDGTIVAETVETHPGRPYKIVSGYAAVFLTLLLTGVWVRPTRAGLVLRG